MLISLLLSASIESFNTEFVPGSAAKFEFDFRKLISIQWWLQHLSDAYAENPLHMVTESVLIIFIFYLLFRHEKPASKNQDKLTAREEEELISEWKPEPLVSEKCINKWSQNNEIYLKSGASAIVYDENNKSYIHLSSHNYLGMANHERVKQAAKETIQKYAVGSCGPRGFYGTTDVHLNLEKKLSDYFGRSSIIYPDYMGCNASVITAFAKRGDLLLIDEGCHFLITQGALLSRSNVIWYPHNDMKKLESYLQTVQEEDERHNRALNRRFIITEGLFHNYGDICNLNDIIQLKNKYKYRLILDDSHALGVLHIKGSPGYWNIPFKNIDVYLSSMDTALGSTGAFCIGSEEIIHHQTLSGSGYVFTASSPPFQCTATQEALNIFEQNGQDLIKNLQDNAKLMRKLLFDSSNRWCLCGNHDISPLIHLQLSNIEDDVAQLYLERVARLAQEEGVLVYPNAYLPQEYGIPEKTNPKPSLRICITQEHTKQQLTQSANIIKNILINVLSNNGQVKKSNKTKHNNDNQTKKNSKFDRKSEDSEDDNHDNIDRDD